MGQLQLNGKVLTMDQSLEDQGVKELVGENGWKGWIRMVVVLWKCLVE